MKFIDLVGKKFSRLTVISRAGNKGKHARWNCKCDCGNEVVVHGGNIRRGHTRSCGCLHSETIKECNKTHGMCEKKEYGVWAEMIKRCTNPNYKRYKDYGGRGISVCDRWRKFENFYADMGDRPKGTSIDRIDNDGNYNPNNCRWATNKEQCRNQRSNVMLTFQGRTLCLSDWAVVVGIGRTTIRNRLSTLNWSVEKALTTPVRQ